MYLRKGNKTVERKTCRFAEKVMVFHDGQAIITTVKAEIHRVKRSFGNSAEPCGKAAFAQPCFVKGRNREKYNTVFVVLCKPVTHDTHLLI